MSSHESDGGDDAGTSRVPKGLTIAAVVSLVVGIAVFVAMGLLPLAGGSERETARERETVVDVAEQVIINAFSFDHRDVDQSLENLAAASTGEFLAEQEQWAEDVRTRVVEQKAVTTATVSHAGVAELDSEAGSAAVLVVFTAHSEREGQEDITGRQAMRVDLTREDDEWKASAVNQVGVTVPVGQSSASVQELDGLGADTGGGQAPAEDGADDADETPTPAPTTAGR